MLFTRLPFNFLFRFQHSLADTERLIPGSIPELVMHRCVLGKGTLRVFPIRAKQLWWPSLTEDLPTELEEVLCVGVVRQAQSACFIQTNTVLSSQISFWIVPMYWSIANLQCFTAMFSFYCKRLFRMLKEIRRGLNSSSLYVYCI